MPASKLIRVLIADDHAVVRVGLSSMLANEGDIEIVGEAENGVQAVALYKSALPDVALFDVRMPEMDGIEALRQIRAQFPKARVLMLSTAELDEEVALAAKAGASGYLTKTSSPATLAAAVRAICRGEMQFSRGVRQRLAEREQLSPRELEVLAGMARGESNRQIGQALHLSEHTIKTYVKGVLGKLGVQDRAGAVAAGFSSGILKV